MKWVTVSLLLGLFLGTGCCQEQEEELELGLVAPWSIEVEKDAGSTAEDSVEDDDRQYEDELEMMCDELENDESAQACTNDTEGTPITLPGTCGNDATCRYRLYTCPRTFRAARRRCRAIGGKLVTIRNFSQNQQIKQTIQKNACIGRVWIGLRKACRAYHYRWIDGTRCAYRNWTCGQHRRRRRPRCAALMIRSGKWISLPCRARVPFLCRV